MKQCELCNKKVKKISLKNPPTCLKCYRKNKEELCSKCNKIGRPEKRNEDGTSICSRCYKRPKEICSVCNLKKIIHNRNGKKRICQTCYNKTYRIPKAKCQKCGKIKSGYKKVQNGVICRYCYNKSYKLPEENCSMCERNMPVFARRDCGPLCKSCNDTWRNKNDPYFNTLTKIRTRVTEAFKIYSKTGKIQSSKKYGIDYKAIINHLGDCPGKRKDYHIDHIFPLSAFDLDNLTHIKALFAPENHQWLLAKDNLSKSGNYNMEDFKKYLKKFGG